MMSRWDYFTIEELSCPESGEELMDNAFMSMLVQLRRLAGFPFPVSSGYRSPGYNAIISGTGTTGPHTTGRAVDIAISGSTAFFLVKLALMEGFTGIGQKQHGPYKKRFIHLDNLDGEYRPRIWTYS